MSNEVSIYGQNAVVSNGTLTEAEQALIKSAGTAEVRDGDQLIDVEIPEDEPSDEPAGEKPAGAAEETPKEPPKPGVQAELTKAQDALKSVTDDLSSKGVDVAAILGSVTETGALTEDNYKALEAAGYPKNVADALVAGQVAIAQQFVGEVQRLAGGPEEFAALTEFAKASSPQTVTAFNAAVDRGDLGTIEVLLGSLKAQRVAALGTANPQITGKPNTTPTVKGFESTGEMTKAINDKRYGIDKAYTKDVERRIASSSFF